MWTCGHCGAEHTEERVTCTKCGRPKDRMRKVPHPKYGMLKPLTRKEQRQTERVLDLMSRLQTALKK